jgi:K+-sensing histidine kinase KdpD
MTVLLGYLGRTKKATKDPVLLGYLDRQEQAAKAISNEINMTREFKDLGQQPPEWQKLGPAILTVTDRFKKPDITFVMDLPDIEIYADVHLDRVFHRLFSIALMAGDNITRFHIHHAQNDSDLYLYIGDDGTAIPQERKESLPDLQDDGSGMRGLFIAREILSLTGITLTETGTRDRGSGFVLKIPASYYRYHTRD